MKSCADGVCPHYLFKTSRTGRHRDHYCTLKQDYMGKSGIVSIAAVCPHYPTIKCLFPSDKGCPLFKLERIFSDHNTVYVDRVCDFWEGGMLGQCVWEKPTSGFLEIEDSIDDRYYAGKME